MKRIMRHRLFWPIAALLALILINTIARPQFVKITVQDGRLYGALIDILRNSAPLMLVSLGMTVVIATRGIDLSVGAVMAVSGAVALTIIDGAADPNSLGTVLVALVAALAVSLVLGLWNGLLVSALGIQPIIATLVLMLAGRGVALLITGGFITTVNSTPFEFIASGYVLMLPFAFFISVAAITVIGLIERRTALGVLTEAVGINPEKSYTFDLEARLRMLRASLGDRPNLSVECFENQFLVNYAASVQAQYILRGIRTQEDYEFERGMRQINGRYTQAFNRRHGIGGHLFQGRYRAGVVDNPALVAAVCRDTVRQPVDLGLAADPAAWRWSSHRAVAGRLPRGRTAPAWLALDELLALYGPEPEAARRFGRPIDTLRSELDETFDELEQQQNDDPDINLDSVYYYNPITGLNSVAGLYKFVSNHEERHQKQLREILDDASFPRA